VRGYRFNGAELTYADFTHADVSAADFSRATLFRARFHRVKEQDTIWSSRALALGNDEELARAEDWRPAAQPEGR